MSAGADEKFAGFMHGRWPAMVRRPRARRRRASVCVLVVAAVALVSSLLACGGIAPLIPVTHPAGTPVSSATATAHRDPVVTDQPPAPGAASGTIAQGQVGGHRWAVLLSTSGGNSCYTAYVAYTVTGPPSGPDAEMVQSCQSAADGPFLDPGSGPANPAGDAIPGNLPEQFMVGAVAADVDYFALTFTDGQRLKLIPVSWQGARYVAWVVSPAMTIAGLTAHLGGPGVDSGQTETAVPFQRGGQAPTFGLWVKQGQAALPRASGVIGHGSAGGTDWSASAYEGPWGTCFIPGPGAISCVWRPRLTTTELLGWDPDNPIAAFGSAAPGVAWLRFTLSNGKIVQVTPVSVGNERLFAFWSGAASPTRWTAYDAAGQVTGTGSVTPG